ncbi:MAG: molybdopterin-dependent oxidoreductase [Acidimicrobiales bacterium]
MPPQDDRDEAAVLGRGRAAAVGALAAGAALAAGELAASLAAPLPGPVYAVANRVVDKAPAWFVAFGKNLFGLADKPALIAGTTALAVAIGAGLGLASRRRPRAARAGIGAFGLLGVAAVAADAQGGWLGAVVVNAVAVAVGWAVLGLLHRRAARPFRDLMPPAATGDAPEHQIPPHRRRAVLAGTPIDPAVTRRSFLTAAGVVGAGAVVAGAAAGQLRARSSARAARDAVTLAPGAGAGEVAAAVAEAEASSVAATAGISPLITPNREFYLIDTALLRPKVDPGNWSLRITGLVDRELTLSYDDLLARATTVAPVTLSCVSNEVGGTLVGNAVWQGVPLVDLLDEAGVRPGATQVASRSVDGWTCGFPTEAAYDGRTALVAVGMNGEPLPLDHGFPARLVVSGLYGYVSATKWLSEIELTTFEAFDGYWIPRGWAKLGPVKTQSRIDTPRRGAEVAAGEVAVAGVAWAPHTGIAKVEVQVDEGPWREATLGDALGPDAWRQWVLAWSATPGRHTLRVRATDASGTTQTDVQAPPVPDGATGWHEVTVTVA